MRRCNCSSHSFSFAHRIPSTPCSISSANAPILLAIVGTPTIDASTHLFSDFAALKRVSSNGAKLISTEAINSGNFFHSIKGDEIIRSFKSSNSFGIFNSPTTFKYTLEFSCITFLIAGRIISKSLLCVMLPLK